MDADSLTQTLRSIDNLKIDNSYPSDNNLGSTSDNVYMFNRKTQMIEEVYYLDAMYKMYYEELRLPTHTDVGNASKEIKDFFNKISFNQLKEKISNNELFIPLFDIYHSNLYLINGSKVFLRVVYDGYRFPDPRILDYIEEESKKITLTNLYVKNKVLVRKVRKYRLMREFLDQIDLKVVYECYLKVFFKYSVFNNYTLTCIRPSFLQHYEHLTPFYTQVELIKLARNMGLDITEFTKEEKDEEDLASSRLVIKQKKLDKICSVVSRNDVSSDILRAHQRHIISTNKVGLFKYYTLQGSYHVNEYLRNLKNSDIRDEYLEEKIIRPIWETVITSPAFDKDYYVYRFVHNDDFLSKLKIGEIFEDLGFTSVTRDPFYKSDVYHFGFILLKIKIPAGIKGAALSLELTSNINQEQELILAPHSRLLLKSRDSNVPYYHVDAEYAILVKTKYEFEYIENCKPGKKITTRNEEISRKTMDFLELSKRGLTKQATKDANFFREFQRDILSDQTSFLVKIGKSNFVVYAEHFNSIGIYDDFFAIKTTNGLGLYCIENGYLLFYIEIGSNSGLNQIHANYSLKYTSLDRESIIDDDSFFMFISSIAYFFQIPKVFVHMDHKTKDIKSDISGSKENKNDQDDYKYNSSYPVDIYQYLAYDKRKYENFMKYDIIPQFSYEKLKNLKEEHPLTILNKDDKDELYQTYLRSYNIVEKGNNIAEFYVWLVDNNCFFSQIFIKKMFRLFSNEDNPFQRLYYILDAYSFLYNKGKIYSISDKLFSNYQITYVPVSTYFKTTKYREMLKRYKQWELLS